MYDDNNERPIIPSLEKLKKEFHFRAQNAPTEEERAHWRQMLFMCVQAEEELMEILEDIKNHKYTREELEYFARTGKLPHWDEEDEEDDDDDEYDDDDEAWDDDEEDEDEYD